MKKAVKNTLIALGVLAALAVFVFALAALDHIENRPAGDHWASATVRR